MKMHPKDYRFMFALVALLFVVTIVHSLAIIKFSQNQDQQAQVLQVFTSDTSKSSVKSAGLQVRPHGTDCIEMTPDYNLISSQEFAPGIGQTAYRMYFSVTNTCSQDIKIINPNWLIGQHTAPVDLLITGIQKNNYNSTPIDVDPLNNSYGIEVNHETLACYDCPFGLNVYFASPLGEFDNNGTPSIQAYSLPAGSTGWVGIEAKINMPWNNTDDFRVVPLEVQYFYDSALSDNTVSANEIKTHTISPTDSNSWATDYTRVFLQ